MFDYPHLPLAFTRDSMTTLGVPVSELHVAYKVSLNHLKPIAVGRDRANRGAYVAFPTWTFVQVSWSEAAQLLVLLAQHLRVHDSMWGHQPPTGLFRRLLNATQRAGNHPTERMLDNFLANLPADHWHAHAHKLLRTPNTGMVEDLLVERAEAADLCTLLAPTNGGRPDLLDRLVEAALPEVLFPATAHGRFDLVGRRARVLVEGRNALPDALLSDR
jgi:hypothetical protein